MFTNNAKCIALLFLYLTSMTYQHSFPIYNPDKPCNDPNNIPSIKSWHVHVQFWYDDTYDRNKAWALRTKFMNDFKSLLSDKVCEDDFFNDVKLCMFNFNHGPIGPWLFSEFSVFFTDELYFEVSSWWMQNRGKFNILIHPNTGCQIQDHTDWALWGGDSFPVDINIFGKNEPFPWSADEY